MPEPLIAAIVLAAGSSTRFGPKNKLLADTGGRSVIESSLANVAQCDFDTVVVVIAPDQPEIDALIQSTGFVSVVNPHPESGMGVSIACGMEYLLQKELHGLSGVAIFLGDMPSVTHDVVSQLVESFKSSGCHNIVRPINEVKQKIVPGHPVIFPSDLSTEVTQFDGDVGAKQLIAKNQARLTEVKVTDIGATQDIDYPWDLPDHSDHSDHSDNSDN